ncbi:MAG: tetratricopeptide repeat protein [Myxococcales bacterium]|nr:tetratricopeptide repeat protein [Myxococcales bacterium]
MRGLMIWVALLSGAAFAGKPSTEAREAKVHFDQGVALEGEGRFEEALPEFGAAQAIYPSAENVLHLAECQEALGQLRAAIASYQRYLDAIGEAIESVQMRQHLADLQAAFHTGEAKRLQEERRFAEAIHEYEEAQKVKADPKRWYEMALCQEEMGESARAVETYERYLKEVPDAGDAGEVRGRIAVLSGKKLGTTEVAPVVAVGPAPARGWHTSKAGWAMAIGGLALGGGAGAMFGLRASASKDADGARSEGQFLSAVDSGTLYSGLGVGFAAVAGVALLTGVILFVLHARPPDPPPPRAVPSGRDPRAPSTFGGAL